MSLLTRIFNRDAEPSPEQRSISVSEPAAVTLFGGVPALSGVTVSEASVMGLSAVAACVDLLSTAIAQLPMRTVVTKPDGTTQRSVSWLDNPGGADGPTPFEFVEDMIVSLALRGNWYGLKIFGGAGQILWLQPIPASCVSIEVKNNRKIYRVSLENGKTVELTDNEIVHIRGRSLDGIRGVSLITLARQSLGTAIAGESVAGRFFKNGMSASAIVTPTEDELNPEDVEAMRANLANMAGGEVNAGSIAVLSRGMKVEKWSIDPADAQFLESRRFSVAEIARWFRVPPHMIGDLERSTSWGTGIDSQTIQFQRFVLQPWTARIEARLGRLLPPGLKVEFDYRQLIAGSPKEEIELLVKQAGQAILTVDEARAILNLPPMPEQPIPA